MILGIYGESKSGKTTLVEKLIKAMKEKGYRVGSVKNIHIENFTIDTEGKDTWKHSRVGAEVVVANSQKEVAFLVNRYVAPKDIASIIEKIAELDMVIVEGYWNDDNPKVAVGDIEEKPNTVLRYSNNFDEVLGYAIEGIEVEMVLKKLPGLDCGKCGMETCKEFAMSIRLDKNTFDDCYYFSEKRVSLEVDGKEVPLGKFAKDIVAGTIGGMISSLKGVEAGKDIRIEIKG
jgi:molybdopterin-guanine dinucleotide biosynthesis protein B